MIEFQFSFKHWLSLSSLMLATIVASIEPLEFSAYVLHQAGTVFMLIILLICLKKTGLNFLSFLFYLVFLLIHVVGAHYLYSFVPYNEWLIHSFNFDLNQAMGWTRNMYDRLVHFSYGLLLYPFLYRLFQVWLPPLKPRTLFVLVIQFIIVSSVLYEWLEWWIAIGLSPTDAENYNGQQGDIWDAHKDILLATIGGILMGIIALLNRHKKALD